MSRLSAMQHSPGKFARKLQAEPSSPLADTIAEIRDVVLDLQSQIAVVRKHLSGCVKSHFTVDEFGQLVGRAPYTVRTWIRQGKLAATRIADTGPKGRLLIPHTELQRLVADGRGGAMPAAVFSADRNEEARHA